MKKILSLLLSIIIVISLTICSNAQTTISPDTPSITENQTENDINYGVTCSCSGAAEYETARKTTYDKMLETLTDSEIRNSEYALFAYPLCLLVRVNINGSMYDIKSFDVTESTFELSLFGDILPSLIKNGIFESICDGFEFRFAFCLVLKDGDNTVRSERFGSVYSESFSVPAFSCIEYDAPEGTKLNSPEFYFYPIENDIILTFPEKDGYTFTGFTDSSGRAVDRVEKNSRYARITLNFQAKTYQLRFVLTTRDGYSFIRCKTNNPTEYTVGNEIILSEASSPSGWVFSGWYADADFSGEAVTKISASDYGDIVLYAKWLTDEEAIEAKWGDLDSDGKITAADARIALRSSVNLEKLSSDIIAKADFAQQGRLSAADARHLLRVAVGLDKISDILAYYNLL